MSNNSESKLELRKKGEALLKERRERIRKQLQQRGIIVEAEVADAVTETRAIETRTARAATSVEPRGLGRTLHGSAVVYRSWSQDLGGFREQVAPGAFDRTLKASRLDLACLYGHDWNKLLGRTKAGTLKVSDSQRSLDFDCPLPSTQIGRDVAEMCARGDLSACSFAFSMVRDDWNQGANGLLLRTLLDCELYEISAVTSPAYPATSCGLRSVHSLSEWEARESMAARLVIAHLQAGKPVPESVQTSLDAARAHLSVDAYRRLQRKVFTKVGLPAW